MKRILFFDLKKSLLIAFMAFLINAFSQPIILNANNLPAPGTAFLMSAASTGTDVGPAGANQTWNLSAVTLTALGTINVINPSVSTFSASFPTANYAYSFSGTYSYFNSSAIKMETQASSITTPSSGDDFTPNPKTVLKFPFNFNDTQADTWQKVGGSVTSVTITYDGYGTLIMPAATYSNIVRVKEDYGFGIVNHRWYSLNPLICILSYDFASSTTYFTEPIPTGITELNNFFTEVNFYPNPAKDKIVMQLSETPFRSCLKLFLMNPFGQIIKDVSINSKLTNIELEQIPNGIYFYHLQDKGNILKTGKIIVE